jgi:hypothetical protein
MFVVGHGIYFTFETGALFSSYILLFCEWEVQSFFLNSVPRVKIYSISHLRKPSVRFSLTLISPLADFIATEMPPIGLCDLPFFTDRTLTIFGVTVEISPRKNSDSHEVWTGGLQIIRATGFFFFSSFIDQHWISH